MALLTTVAVFFDLSEAHMLRGRLESEGIPASIHSEHHVGMNWGASVALGGARVQVPSVFAEAAHDIVAKCRNGDYAAALQQEVGDLDTPCCPFCGSDRFKKRRSMPQFAASAVVLWFAGLIAPPRGWNCTCEGCGNTFRIGADEVRRAMQIWLYVLGTLIAGFLASAAIAILRQYLALYAYVQRAALVLGLLLLCAGVGYFLRRMNFTGE